MALLSKYQNNARNYISDAIVGNFSFSFLVFPFFFLYYYSFSPLYSKGTKSHMHVYIHFSFFILFHPSQVFSSDHGLFSMIRKCVVKIIITRRVVPRQVEGQVPTLKREAPRKGCFR